MNFRILILKYLDYARIILYVVMSVTFVVAVLPNTKDLMGVIPLSGDPVHFIVFVGLALLMDFAYPIKSFLTKFLLLCSYGLLIECVQYFLPYRHFSLITVVVDGIGVWCYFILLKPLVKLPKT